MGRRLALHRHRVDRQSTDGGGPYCLPLQTLAEAHRDEVVKEDSWNFPDPALPTGTVIKPLQPSSQTTKSSDAVGTNSFVASGGGLCRCRCLHQRGGAHYYPGL
ncbi:unnamed protein product [Linum trigynum]|uniref:Uncharacterized protein n=1 Tax=Linum trigynum TaxID=586398 RepID=A0AAV2EM46_9ROSI